MTTIKVQVLRCKWSKCKRPGDNSVEVDEAEYIAACEGDKRIQDAMPTTPAPIREQMMTGTHPECWDEMWGEDGDECEGAEMGVCPGGPNHTDDCPDSKK